jgi:predicted acyltransferase
LFSGGYVIGMLALFYFLFDILPLKLLAFPLVVVGMNSILIYMSGKFIQWSYTNKGFFQWLGDLAGEPWNAVLMAMTMILIKWVFLYFLYKRKMFLKI